MVIGGERFLTSEVPLYRQVVFVIVGARELETRNLTLEEDP